MTTWATAGVKEHHRVDLHKNQYLGRRSAAQAGEVEEELCSRHKGSVLNDVRPPPDFYEQKENQVLLIPVI